MIIFLYSALVSPLLVMLSSHCNILARGQWSGGERLEGQVRSAPSQTSPGPSAGSSTLGWRRDDLRRAEHLYANMHICGGYVLGALGDRMQAWQQKADTEAEENMVAYHWPMVAWVAG